MNKRFLAAAGIWIHDRQILLVANRYAQGVVWGLPGGEVEQGESVTEGLCREVKEETGLTVTTIHHLCYVAHRQFPQTNSDVTNLVFRVSGPFSQPFVSEDDYVTEARWIPIASVSEFVTDPARQQQLLDYLHQTDQRPHFSQFCDQNDLPVLTATYRLGEFPVVTA